MYDLTSMSCSYVLAGHTDVILCLDTCLSSSGRTLIVTGSKDNTVSLTYLFLLFRNMQHLRHAFAFNLYLPGFQDMYFAMQDQYNFFFCYSDPSVSIG